MAPSRTRPNLLDGAEKPLVATATGVARCSTVSPTSPLCSLYRVCSWP